MSRRTTILLALFVLSSSAILRIPLLSKQALWPDEIFSLAIATGHSLEHPAEVADSEIGDYIEPKAAADPEYFRQYLEHDTNPAGIRRVARATFLSDTSPPLYYLLLNGWTRVTGTSDAALRSFSLFWFMVSLPLLWLVGQEVAGSRAAWIACLLFTFSPLSIYYATEGRMYSLTWFFTLALMGTSLLVYRNGPKASYHASWLLIAVLGLLTHYFFLFICLASLVWLVLQNRRISLLIPIGFAVGSALLVAPWYVMIPRSLSLWRVSAGWMDQDLPVLELATGTGHLMWKLVFGGIFGSTAAHFEVVGAALFGSLATVVWLHGPRSLWTRKRMLLLLCFLLPCLGLLAFDIARDTFAVYVPRYALMAIPAAMLLTSAAISRLGRTAQIAFVSSILLLWAPGIWEIHQKPYRETGIFREVARVLEDRDEQQDLLIVHSIPSGVLGVARYMKSAIPMASWVGQLGHRKVPEDIESLISVKNRVAFIKVHEVGEPAPEQEWLRRNASLYDKYQFDYQKLLYFRPKDSSSF